jgi:hypothetical protein
MDAKPTEDGQGDVIDDASIEEGHGDIIEDQVPADADDVIGQGVFYYELAEMSGDYGDGLSPREGAELTNDLLTDMGLYAGNGIPADQCVYISFDALAVLDSADGRECYMYSVGTGTPEGGLMGDDYEVIYQISVDYGGQKTAAVYSDFTGGDVIESDPGDGGGEGRGDMIESDPGDGELVAWWGIYAGSGYSIDINEVTGQSFYYVIRMTTTTENTVVTEGRGEIEETGYFAMAGDMGFSLYEDLSAIDIFASESSEWADLRGQYERIE